ncbi:MAG: DUF1688 family protein [bacterium]|nr:DUF1688 family protein [bacterium]
MHASEAETVAYLRSAQAVRERAHYLFDLAAQGDLEHFVYHPEALAPTADYVCDLIKTHHPTLDIPLHSRLRHFSAGGRDRLAEAALDALAQRDRGLALVELSIISVLLDAGAGDRWRYTESQDGTVYTRSEGLAVASWQMYWGGLFSSCDTPAVDADRLASLSQDELAQALQVTAGNPLVGLSGRLELLRNLSSLMQAQPDVFGESGRLGLFYDYVDQLAVAGTISAGRLLTAVLDTFSEVWPARLFVAGVPLGDVWEHVALQSFTLASGLIPFHKLSQWLSYSLIEPLAAGGIEVSDLDALTALPEYRNGGLLIDMGVLTPRLESALGRLYQVSDALVVEWRALTVALLDKLADLIRQRLGRDRTALPLANILEGGTWRAGRQLAFERRGGLSPVQVQSDGTVF